MKKRSSFTLLEVMVCVALLAVFSGVCAWKGHELFQHYLLRSSAKCIVRQVEAAQMLAVSYQSDIRIELLKDKEDFFLVWRTDEPRFQQFCTPRKMRGVKNLRIDNNKKATTMVAQFCSISATSCKYIYLEGKEETCRIELRQGRPLSIQTIHDEGE